MSTERDEIREKLRRLRGESTAKRRDSGGGFGSALAIELPDINLGEAAQGFLRFLGQSADALINPRIVPPADSVMKVAGEPLLPKVVEPISTPLRYVARGGELGGMGLGGEVLSQLLNPYELFPYDSAKLREQIGEESAITSFADFLPDREKLTEARRAFNELRKQGDWDAGMTAYKDILDAGPGYWGASEVLAAALPTGIPWAAGTGLLAKSAPIARGLSQVAPSAIRPTVARGAERGVRGIGHTLRAPWEAEEAFGRGLVRGVKGVGRGLGLLRRPVYTSASKLGRTRYEQGIDESGVPEGVLDTYVAEPQSRGRGFYQGILRVRETHPYGAAVEVKDPAFYSDPTTRLYLTPDDTAGVAVTPDGDLVSVYKDIASTQRIGPLLNEASKVSRTLDAYDIGAMLPNLYAGHGWRPAARVRFNPDYAPEGWNYELLGEPDIVLMVRDVDGVSGLLEVPRAGGYGKIRDSIPIFDDFDEALKVRDAAVARLPSPSPTPTVAPVAGAVTPDIPTSPVTPDIPTPTAAPVAGAVGEVAEEAVEQAGMRQAPRFVPRQLALFDLDVLVPNERAGDYIKATDPFPESFPPPAGATGEAAEILVDPSLPKKLRGAKPRYNLGRLTYLPRFESDIDKAFFIISQKTKSKNDGLYVAFLKGLFPRKSIKELRQFGSEVRGHIKQTITGQPTGEVRIPRSLVLQRELDPSMRVRSVPEESAATGRVAAAEKTYDDILEELRREATPGEEEFLAGRGLRLKAPTLKVFGKTPKVFGKKIGGWKGTVWEGEGGQTNIPYLLTMLRRHEGAINAAQSASLDMVRRAEQIFIRLGYAVNIEGRAVIKAEYTKRKGVMDQLFNALHSENKDLAPLALRGAYDELRKLTNWEEMLRREVSPDMEVVEHYFYRGWKPPESVVKEFKNWKSTGRVGERPVFDRARVKKTWDEMRDLEFEPLNWNPFEQWRISHMQGMRYRQQMMLIDRMKKTGIAKPVADPSITKFNNYRIPEIGPAFEGKYVGFTDEAGNPNVLLTGRYAVHEEVAKRLENIYGKTPGAGTKKMKIIDTITFVPKRAKLFASFFQQQDFLQRSLFGTWTQMVDQFRARSPIGIAKAFAAWPKTAKEIIEANLSPDFRQKLKTELTSTKELVAGRPGIHFKGMMEAGLSIRDVSIFPDAVDDMARSVASELGLLGKGRSVMRLIKQLESASRRGLFEGVYPAAQMTDIKNNIVHVMVRNFPDATDEAINGMVAQYINLRYSTVPASQSVFQNRYMRAALQRLFFSIGESEGLLRQGTSAITGPYAKVWQQHWLASYLALMSTAVVIHGASTGEMLPADRFKPLSEDNWGPLPFGYSRQLAAPTVPIEGRGGTEITLDIVGQMDTVFRVLDPMGFLSSRESVPVRTLQNQLLGTDFFGAPIDTVGPAGLVSRISALTVDMFAPIGLGEPLIEYAREKVPGVGEILPPGEERLGGAGLWQAPGINLRPETTSDLLDRITSEGEYRILGRENPRYGQIAERWEDLTPGQQRIAKQTSGVEEELRYRTETGALRGSEPAQARLEVESEESETIEELSILSQENLEDVEWGRARYVREQASEILRQHYSRIGEFYDDDEEDVEPEPGTVRHHLWEYRQIFKALEGRGRLSAEEWQEVEDSESAFWGNLPPQDVQPVLDSMRAFERKLPEPIRRLLNAKRYVGSFKMALRPSTSYGSEQYSYWDLKTHPAVVADIARRTGQPASVVLEYLRLTSAERFSAKITNIGSVIEKAILQSQQESGMLGRLRTAFKNQAPSEWLYGMMDAGYHYIGREDLERDIYNAIARGGTRGFPDYEQLYFNNILSKRAGVV